MRHLMAVIACDVLLDVHGADLFKLAAMAADREGRGMRGDEEGRGAAVLVSGGVKGRASCKRRGCVRPAARGVHLTDELQARNRGFVFLLQSRY